MNYHESLILTLFDITAYLLIAKKLLEIKKFYWKDLILVITLTVLVATGSFFIPDQYNFFISAIFLIIGFLVYFKLTFFKSLILYIISIVVLIIVQLISMLPVYLIFGGIEQTFTNGIIAQCIGMAVVILIFLFLPVHAIYRLANKKNRVIKILLLNIFILAVCIPLYWYLDIDGMINNIIIYAGISLALVVLNGIIIRNGLRNEHEEKELAIYKKYLPVIENLTDDIRKRQHDYSNHVQALKGMALAHEDINKVRTEMELYSTELSESIKNKELLFLDNKILAGFLFSKTHDANVENIEIKYKLSNISFRLMNYELIEVISILLDNAIEACKPGEKIELSLYCDMGLSTIKVTNPAEPVSKEALDSFFEKGYSTKSPGKRGYGLSRLSDIVKKYDGKIKIYNENKERQQNHVVFLVSFP